MVHGRRYKKYEGKSGLFGTVGVASAFTFVATLSVIFRIFDIDFIGLAAWGYWLYIPAFFIWIGAISTFVRDRQYQKQVLALFQNYPDGSRIKVEQIGQEVGVDDDSVLRVLMDLRTDNKINYHFDYSNGEIIVGVKSITVQITPTASVEKTLAKGSKFCVYCGKQVPLEALFCPNCGSSL
jgi:hypothetical protein